MGALLPSCIGVIYGKVSCLWSYNGWEHCCPPVLVLCPPLISVLLLRRGLRLAALPHSNAPSSHSTGGPTSLGHQSGRQFISIIRNVSIYWINRVLLYAYLCAFSLQLLKKYNMSRRYPGQEEVNGEMYTVEDIEDGPGAFRAHLDVGLSRTTTGAKVFAVMKGVIDGGVEVPHSEKRFPGYDAETKEFNAEVLRGHIFGEHVANYMRALMEEDEDSFKRQFSQYARLGITADEVSNLFHLYYNYIYPIYYNYYDIFHFYILYSLQHISNIIL